MVDAASQRTRVRATRRAELKRLRGPRVVFEAQSPADGGLFQRFPVSRPETERLCERSTLFRRRAGARGRSSVGVGLAGRDRGPLRESYNPEGCTRKNP
jgi:hypothetical protein